MDDSFHVRDFVNWRKIQDTDRRYIKDSIDSAIMRENLLLYDVFACRDINCSNPCHEKGMDRALLVVREILLQSTAQFRYVHENRFKIIPGWNDNVKEFYNRARKEF